MASRDEVLSLARDARGLALRGQLRPEDLSPKGHLLLRIGRGEVDVDALQPDQRTLVGLDPTFMQRVGEMRLPGSPVTLSEGTQRLTEVTEPRITTSPAETVVEPIGQAATGPTLTEQILGPGFKDIGLVERGLNLAFSPIVGASRLVEQGFEQVPRLVGAPPVSSPVSRAAGALAEGLGMVLPGLKRPSVGPGGRLRTEAIPGVPGGERIPTKLQQAPVNVVEAPIDPSGSVPLDVHPFRPTLPAIPPARPLPRPSTRALPEAPREALVRGFQEPPTVLPGRGIPPETELIIRRPVEAPPKAVPSQAEVAARRAGIDLTTPAERPLSIVDQFGSPIMVPTRRPLPPGGPAPATFIGYQETVAGPPIPLFNLTKEIPGHPKGSTVGLESLRSAGFEPPDLPPAPARPPGPPPSVQPSGGAVPPPSAPPPLGPAQGARPPMPPQAPRPSRAGGQFAHVDVGTVNLSDPDEVRVLVRGVRGINFGAALRGEAEGIPFFFKNSKGLAFDELVDQVSQAQGLNPRRVERDLLHTMERYTTLKQAQRTQQMQEPPAPGQAPPPPGGEALPKGFVGQGPEAPVEPPPAPKIERTAFGDQTLIPGTEGREMPPTALRPKGPQGDVADTPLFGQEKTARNAALERAQTSLPTEGAIPPGMEGFTTAEEWAGLAPEARQEMVQAWRKLSEGGRASPQLLAFLGRTTAGAAAGGTQGDTLEERVRNAAIGGVAAAALPSAARFARGLGQRGALGGSEPPPVPPQFRREVIRPVQPEQVRANIGQVREQVTTPRTPGGTPGGPSEPVLPADTPGNPQPGPGRAARFFAGLKGEFLSRVIPPEEVVRGDPGGTAVVRMTYRAYDDGLLLKRELEDAARRVYEGLTPQEIATVNRVLDTPDVPVEAYRQMLPPRLAEVAEQARRVIFDAGADGTGLPKERRITGYFPRFRDKIRVQDVQLVQVGDAYIPKTYIEDVPQHYTPFFHKTRTTEAPANAFGLDGVLIYQRAVARHLTLNGGFHPQTGEVIPGFLNEIQPLLNQTQPVYRPFVGEVVNYFLGTPETRTGTPLQHQLSRITRNVEFSQLIGANLGSPLANLTQQINTLAEVSPTSFLRGYADLLDPTRRALAQRYLGLPELAKADLELVQRVSTNLDRVEDLTARLAHMSGVIFRLSETGGNRYHAFLSGLRDAEGLGLQGRAAIEYARDVVEVTQFPGAGPAKIPLMRGPVGSVLGQFKQFQIRQVFNFKRIVQEDINEFTAKLRGHEIPVIVRGRQYVGPDGTPLTRHPSALPFRRTAKYLLGLTLVGGPDAVFPGLDEYLQEQGVKVPGLFPALGSSIAAMAGFDFTPSEITRSLLFFLPGPLIGHVQDALSASTGVNFGRGLTELVRGDIGDDLDVDQRVDRALRGFLPVAGISASRVRRSMKMMQTPGEERAARTVLEALGLEAATGPLVRRTDIGDPTRVLFGIQPVTGEREREERVRLGDLDRRARRAVELAANDMAAGDEAAANAKLRDAEQRLKLPPGSLDVSLRALTAGEQRRQFTPLERQQKRLEERFPFAVEESRRRAPGQEPEDEARRRGLSVPRPRLR